MSVLGMLFWLVMAACYVVLPYLAIFVRRNK